MVMALRSKRSVWTWDEAVRSYRRSLQADGKSPDTFKSYNTSLEQFRAFLVTQNRPTDPDRIERDDVAAFIAHLRLKGRKPGTIGTRYDGLKGFFRWLEDEGEIDASPMAKMHRPQVPLTDDIFLCVILGTGVGSAVVMDGRPLRGSHGLAGEIGHLQVDGHRLLCGCGGRGCTETVAAAAALSRRYAAATGRRIPAEEVLDQMLGGDPVATGLWADAVSALATALAAAAAVVDCGLVIFGGGMAAAGSLLLDPVCEALAQRLSLGPPSELVVATLGSAAGTLGAAAGALTAVGRDDDVGSWRSSAVPVLPALTPSGSDGARRWSV
jgi:hypothetical protein